MKKYLIGLVVVVLVGVGIYFLINSSKNNSNIENQNTESQGNIQENNTTQETQNQEVVDKTKTVIGKSVGGKNITAYHYGIGNKEVLFVAGVHGGYEWNTALLAYNVMEYLNTNPSEIPADVKVTIIPALNSDGLYETVGMDGSFNATDVSSSQDIQIASRFNGHKVDLNRNFDCDWKSTGTWQNTTVSGGTAPFSEPETSALRDYVLTNNPVAVVAFYSAASGIYLSSCGNGVLSETQTIADLYAKASGYPVYKDFDYYTINGDMTNWLAKKNIPAINVLLTDHQNTEWNKNLAGVKAILAYYAE